jgi:hypothetical protein
MTSPRAREGAGAIGSGSASTRATGATARSLEERWDG